MKLDKIRFATLIGFISCRYALTITQNDMSEIDSIVDVDMPEVARVDVSELHALLSAIQAGKKIDAIKIHRGMTGYGLKESKDVIEAYWSREVVSS